VQARVTGKRIEPKMNIENDIAQEHEMVEVAVGGTGARTTGRAKCTGICVFWQL
jgi:hypothetical protein